jgi:hypothetical protein
MHCIVGTYPVENPLTRVFGYCLCGKGRADTYKNFKDIGKMKSQHSGATISSHE